MCDLKGTRQFQVIPTTTQPNHKRISPFTSIACVPQKDKAVSSHTHDKLNQPPKGLATSFPLQVCPKRTGQFQVIPTTTQPTPKKDKSYSFICCPAAFILLPSSLQITAEQPISTCFQSFRPSKAV